MPSTNVIRWRDGAGWIVLSGGQDPTNTESDEIEAEALIRVAAGAPMAYIWAASDIETADLHLDLLHDLGAPTGYLVDVLTEDDESLRQQLGEAGLIVIGDGIRIEDLRSGLLGTAIQSIGAAFGKGAIVYGIGQGAAVLGKVFADYQGLNWIENAVIVANYEQADSVATLRDVLSKNPDLYGLGIGTGSAIALGPTGEVETWGNKQITIALGRNLA